MTSSLCAVCLGVHLLISTLAEGTHHVLLKIDEVPPDGLVVADVDLTAAMRWCKLSDDPVAVSALTEPEGQSVAVQWVPSVQYDPRTCLTGTLVLQLPREVQWSSAAELYRASSEVGSMGRPGADGGRDGDPRCSASGRLSFADRVCRRHGIRPAALERSTVRSRVGRVQSHGRLAGEGHVGVQRPVVHCRAGCRPLFAIERQDAAICPDSRV